VKAPDVVQVGVRQGEFKGMKTGIFSFSLLLQKLFGYNSSSLLQEIILSRMVEPI
jgi:hypothetical protein